MVGYAEFYINEDAKKLLTPDTIILFEILDFNHQNLMEKKVGDLSSDNFFRVCWGEKVVIQRT